MEKQGQAPGLKYRTRKDGSRVPVWIAKPEAIKAGYSVKTVNLSGVPEAEIPARCQRLNAEMKKFLAGETRSGPAYDGTIASVIRIYQTHEASPYRRLKQGSLKPYDYYLKRLSATVGARRVARVTGLDVLAWHKQLRTPEKPEAEPRIAGAKMALDALKAALSFSAVCGLTDCKRLYDVMRLLAIPRPPPRRVVITAEQVTAIREKARDAKRYSMALVTALQFETTVRQWDLIGQWVPISDPRPSAVIDGRRKWIGPTWSVIGEDLVLRIKPTKTERTSDVLVEVDLSLCPMVVEELAHFPPERRVGPLICNEMTGLPFAANHFAVIWRALARKAKVPDRVWNRDLRAGGVTEGRDLGASIEDTSKLAGHASAATTSRVYDRGVLEAARRVSAIRKAGRKPSA